MHNPTFPQGCCVLEMGAEWPSALSDEMTGRAERRTTSARAGRVESPPVFQRGWDAKRDGCLDAELAGSAVNLIWGYAGILFFFFFFFLLYEAGWGGAANAWTTATERSRGLVVPQRAPSARGTGGTPD